ncbi:hypothetical protein BDZ89DRAFT_353071 [Hymenopellis radicata]|nr:hypothetical protein BDZ89DRAFT_353071 [Hymenopellis radicata]
MLTCPLCAQAVVGRHGLKRHMATHNPETKTLACPYAHTGCTRTFRQPVNLKTHVEAKHTLRKWRCAHCPEVLSSQSSHIRHCQRKHSEHGYAKQRRGAKRRASTSSSSSGSEGSSSSPSFIRFVSSPAVAPVSTYPIEAQQEMKFNDIVMDTTHFVDTMNTVEVGPLAVAVETSLLLYTTSVDDSMYMDTFDWSSWSTNEKDQDLTWTIPEDPLAYITGVNLPNFDFEAELRIQSELFASSSPPPPSSSSSYSPPSSPHCGLHFAPPSPPASYGYYYGVSTGFSPLPSPGWNFDPLSSISSPY